MFDNNVFVGCENPHIALAIFHSDTRKLVYGFIMKTQTRRIRFNKGVVKTDVNSYLVNSGAKLLEFTESFIRMAQSLCKNGTAGSLLRENYLAEEYFGSKKKPDAEDFLIAQLQRVNAFDIENAKICISALADCGGYKSIDVLDRNRFLPLGRETDQAMPTIQKRIGCGNTGWLSLEKSGKNDGMLSNSDKD